MRAVLCKGFGTPETLSLEEIDEPMVGPTDVLVKVKASAINFPDILMIEGKYQFKPEFPFSPGGEFSGLVEKIGDEVSDYKVGEEVFGSIGHGCFAEKISVPSQVLKKKPDHLDFQTAAGISTTYGTSYYALKQRADLKAGETLLVLGAAGGVGLAAVELGKAMGATVIAAASTETKLQVAKDAGADHLINYADGELKDKVKDITNGKGADVIYDPVGGELFDQCMRCINWYGRVLVVGFVGGDIPKVPTNLILLKSCQVIGVFYGSFSARYPKENSNNFDEILNLHKAGEISPLIGAEFRLEEFSDALNCLAKRTATGKIIVNVN